MTDDRQASTEKRSGPRAWMIWVAVSVIALGGLWLRCNLLAKSYWRQAQASLNEGSREDALLQYELAIQQYAPGNRWVSRSVADLQSLAKGYADAGDYRSARLACEDLGPALSSIRGAYQPHAATLKKAQRDAEEYGGLDRARRALQTAEDPTENGGTSNEVPHQTKGE